MAGSPFLAGWRTVTYVDVHTKFMLVLCSDVVKAFLKHGRGRAGEA